MAKGDDAVVRKKNRVKRKRMRGKESVSARVASIIASKKRRKAGKRRISEGMCFSLPTPEDPFNDRNDPKAKKAKKTSLLKSDNDKNQQMDEFPTHKKGDMKLSSKSPPDEVQQQKRNTKRGHGSPDDRPSKFLFLCLNAIQNMWTQEGISCGCEDEPLLASKWGFDFWRSCSSGSDILDTSGAGANREQVAWLVSTASDIITRKEKQGLVIPSPFLLFLVQTQEKAAQVRSVCKALKELGVHTVSLHPGTSLDHQVHGLKSCEPEFLVSTPERLLELVRLKAIDISGVSLLVLDGLESFASSGFLEKIKSIRELISGGPQTVIFSESYEKASFEMVHSLIREPISRLPLVNQ